MDNLSNLIAQLGELRSQKKRLGYDLKQVDKLIEGKEHEIMDMMDDLGVTQTKSEAGAVTLGEAVYPQVEDWDSVYAFIKENDFLHCLEKRFSVTAYREILNMGDSVPGILPFTKRKISFREA